MAAFRIALQEPNPVGSLALPRQILKRYLGTDLDVAWRASGSGRGDGVSGGMPVAAPRITYRRITNQRPLCASERSHRVRPPTGTSTLTIGMWPMADQEYLRTVGI
jgi:hypothetical protein